MVQKNYECMFVLDGKLSEEKREQIIQQFASMAGENTTIDRFGMRKYGFNVVLNFSAAFETLKKMMGLMRITESISRPLFIYKSERMLAQDVIRKQNKLKFIEKKREESAAKGENAQ
ncbi:MAG: 30S ribosomal protein S6 [Christensenellaceae bacterium]|jgi:ribosomal protein S6|nr:30S ribosomal protein S6 [Christensenellaceae bacterium]